MSVGEEAVFRCRHPTADFIGWTVNGSIVGSNPPPDVFASTVQDDDGNTVHTLTIVGRPEYNGTTVVCAAVYLDGRPSELTPEALLRGKLFVGASHDQLSIQSYSYTKILYLAIMIVGIICFSVIELNTYPSSR